MRRCGPPPQSYTCKAIGAAGDAPQGGAGSCDMDRSLSVAFIASNLPLSGLLFTAALHTPETVAVHFPTPGKSIWNIYLLFPTSTFKSSNYPLRHSSNHLLLVTMLVAPPSSNPFSCFCSLSIYIFFSSWHLAHSALCKIPYLPIRL